MEEPPLKVIVVNFSPIHLQIILKHTFDIKLMSLEGNLLQIDRVERFLVEDL